MSRRFSIVFLFLLSSCGYTLQGAGNPYLEKEGIRTVYVAPLSNNTYKPGVENLVHNEVVKKIAAHRRVVLVQDRNSADAVLIGSVEGATYGPSASTTADKLFGNDKLPPARQGSADITVATEYVAALSCSFVLQRTRPSAGKGATVWSNSFGRTKSFPGNNQLDVFGTTSPLINESEFDHALQDLAESMAGDLHESMLAFF